MGAFEYKFLTIMVLAVIAAALIIWGGSLLKRAYGRGTVEAEGGGFKFTAANYGPGVVIFILGFALLIFCVTRTFTRTTVVTTNTTVVENRVIDGVQKTTTTTTTTSTTENAAMDIIEEPEGAASTEDRAPAER